MTNPDSILKSRDITLLTKVCIDKAMVFLVVMHRYESWAIKKDEYWRSDAFKLWCWRRCLRVSSTTRSSKSILKEINSEYSLEGPMPKLKLQYFGHLMWRTDSLEKTLMLGKIAGRRKRGWQRMKWLDGIIDPMDMSLSKLWEIVKIMKAWRAAIYGVAKSQTQLSDWTTTATSRQAVENSEEEYGIWYSISVHLNFLSLTRQLTSTNSLNYCEDLIGLCVECFI